MTVPVPDQLEYISDADGVTKDFPYPKRFLQKDEIVVLLRDGDGVDTPQTLNTHYTIAGSSWPSGGTISFITAPQAPNKVVRYRMTQAKQTVDLENNQRNDAPSVETQLDRLTMAIQDRGDVLSDLFLRSVKVPFGYSGSTVLPWPDPNKLLGWNENGDGFANKEILTVGDLVVGAAGKEVIGKDTVEGIRDFLDIKDPIEKLFDTASLVETVEIDSEVNSIRTAGFSTAGDGGAALYKRVTAEPSHIGKIQSADGAWWELVERVLRPEMFGIKGDGSDENTILQGMLDYSGGKEIAWPNGKTFGYTFLVVPNDVKFSGVGFTFRRLTPNPSVGFRINNWFRADWLRFSSPGGVTGDKVLRIQGSNNTIDYFHAEADAQGVYNSSNWAIEMESNPAGEFLSRNVIKAAYCRNYSTFLTGALLTFIEVSNVVVENYRTAVYFKDIVRSRFVNFRIRGLGNAVNGGPGENGLLLEARTDRATSDLVFEDWTVEDSGEHAYRLGGQRTIQNIWFNHCKAKRSGSSILSGNTSSGEWHGGCGFKVLGGAEAGGTRHKNIYFNQCGVYDVNQTFGSYPAGHGVNNFTPFLIVCCEGVHLNECVVDTESLTTSCRNGILVGHSKGVYLNGCEFKKCSVVAIKPYQETVFAGFPGYATPLEDFHIRGGRYECVATDAGTGLGFYMQEAALYAHKNWSMKGVELRGGAGAVRVEAVGAGGSYTNCNLEFDYADPTSVTESTTTAVVVAGPGATAFLVDVTANNRPAAAGMSVADGSIHRVRDTGAFRLRKGGAWATL